MGRITVAVIAAGGFGSRLTPFTKTAPKPMIPVLGKPLLEWHIEQFKKHGVTDFIFTLHYLPEVIQDHFGDGSRFGVRIRYFIEPEPLGTGGALKSIPDLPERFFYAYGDMISLVDYEEMQVAYEQKLNPVGMQRVARTDAYADADVLELDDGGRAKEVHRKPHQRVIEKAYRMRGVFILERTILQYVQKVPADLAKDVLAAAIHAGENIYGYESDAYSKGIDTYEKLREVEEHLASIFKKR